MLFPALHCLSLQRFGSQFGEFDSQAVEIGHIREHRLREGTRTGRVARGGAALPEFRDGRLDVGDLETEMIHTRRSLRVRLLEFEERALANLQVNSRRVALGVAVPK